MAVSKVSDRSLDQVLDDVAKSRVGTFYLVDSFGSLYSEDIHSLLEKYIKALPGKTIGFHGHNNQQLAFANTIECIIGGANMLDATMLGIGRGAGNCPMELLISFLRLPSRLHLRLRAGQRKRQLLLQRLQQRNLKRQKQMKRLKLRQ